MEEQKKVVAIDIDYLKEVYFTFDKPVKYTLLHGVEINIYPVILENSIFFNSSYGILDIDKNSSSDPEIISMSYLKFLLLKILSEDNHKQQFYNICHLCLHMENPYLILDENKKALLIELDAETKSPIFIITQKEFEDIRRIILYQNILNYDDEYINPELKKAMKEQDELLSKKIIAPSLERKIAIISTHTGITQKEQFGMSLRSHSLLFNEVVGEVNYQAIKAISLYAGKTEMVEWIYPKNKNKYDEYITTVEKYNKSFGGDGNIQSIDYNAKSNDIQNLITQYGK